MTPLLRRFVQVLSVVTVLPAASMAQGVVAGIGPDSVTTVAARGFAAGDLHRKVLGDNYRDLWTLQIRVPVLHIGQFDGGITPSKIGGGNQTRSLHFVAADSAEYVFRPIYKGGIRLPEDFEGTVVWRLFRDAGSASHPAANIAAVPMMESQRVLNPRARLVFMPDDERLGEHRKEFGGVLGSFEEFPAVPEKGRHWAGAHTILDAEDLLEAINKDPGTRVDARKFLKVVMLDLLLGDNDRHADQWKWAQLRERGPFEPVARDRDKVFVSYEGLAFDLARIAVPSLVTFDSTYPDPRALFENATQFDARILGGLDKSVWEETAKELQRETTDAVIDSTIAIMPRGYAARSRDIAAKLRARRARLPEAALKYYGELFALANVHATDTSDVATVTRRADGSVDVSIAMRDRPPWFQRHYDPADTREIRLYLHGGDDSALITGSAPASIVVRVIGGNGTNTLADRSTVGGRANVARLYDQGHVTNVKYGRDLDLEESSYVDALDSYYNRRPMVHAYGRRVLPQKDFGSSITPVVGLKTGHGLGIVPKVGIARYTYGFRKVPYSTMMQADAGYSTGAHGWKLDLLGDKRFESSDIHLPVTAMMSQIEVIQFRGFGNQVEEDDDPFFDVDQTQWKVRPAIGFSFAPASDVSLGPVVRYTTTDSVSSNFISSHPPFGFRTFGQTGLELALEFDSRPKPDTAKPRVTGTLNASAYPGIWDADGAYESVEGVIHGYVTVPFLTKPVIALRGGGKKLYGNFPYFDAAFLGGGSSFRTEHRQRYAGDASVFGSAELRVPVIRFPTLVPTDIGVLGFADAGRVYLDGESPGGWHSAMGGGFWVGAIDAARNVNVLFTNRSNRRVVVSLGFAY